LSDVGWDVDLRGRDDDLTTAAVDTDALILAVPDAAIADVARTIDPQSGTLVVHLSGALSLDVLAPHPRRASLHPLVAIPVGDRSATVLRGAWMAVDGDDYVLDLAAALEGRVIRVAATDRARYHATAAVAANHVVALLAQVERLAADMGVPAEAFLDLARGSLATVAEVGASAALTGPIARGDWETVRHHLAAIPVAERPTYLALATEAARLAGREIPSDVICAQTTPLSGLTCSQTAEVIT
jgi:predicted short-subunit dehydrogenase-like oxidoreductase (DUF2520 family)